MRLTVVMTMVINVLLGASLAISALTWLQLDRMSAMVKEMSQHLNQLQQLNR